MRYYELEISSGQKWYFTCTILCPIWIHRFLDALGAVSCRDVGFPRIRITSGTNSFVSPRLYAQGQEFVPTVGLKARHRLSAYGKSSVLSSILYPIYRQSIQSGSLPLHAALLEYGGRGFLLVGHSNTGKTTCCRRIPPPWRALCDEEALLLREENFSSRVYPLLNLDDFVNNRTRLVYATLGRIPLAGIFFLKQSESDGITYIGKAEAAARLHSSANDIFLRYEGGIEKDVGEQRLRRFENACQIAGNVPCYSLSVSLRGQFWVEMENAIAQSEPSSRLAIA